MVKLYNGLVNKQAEIISAAKWYFLFNGLRTGRGMGGVDSGGTISMIDFVNSLSKALAAGNVTNQGKLLLVGFGKVV